MIFKFNQHNFQIRRQRGYKKISIRVGEDGIVKISAPAATPNWLIEQLYQQNKTSIEEIRQKHQANFDFISKTKDQYKKKKEAARAFVLNRIAYFAPIYQVQPNRVSIRNQKTRWGSCSRRKNLSFNYKIIDLPATLADYIIVHELCHLIELNHSKHFWDLVARLFTNYKELRKQLQLNSDTRQQTRNMID